ncbi:MAG: cytochrome c oxidase subunit II [Candidatus Kapabacteria bacterium]|nr:cytochrome c oxidase subunit II [Ignavibacteriota bacterium]MCW5885314.1 cytochrome c oxidase subunit II [Candidatus Kapabacteria bacterium]
MFNSASNYADSVDLVMLIIVGISVVLLIGITVAMIYFVYRYNRKRHPVAEQIHGNVILEVIWIVIPTILVMVMFWYGFEGYQTLRADVDDAYEVKVFAFMWGWNFEYPNGKKTDTLYVPLSRKTKLILTSRDVNHSFYVPAFRLKEDVIGGKNHYMILTPKSTGSYDVACAEYCGLNHSMMYTKLHVLEDYAFDQWVSQLDEPAKGEPAKLDENNAKEADAK